MKQTTESVQQGIGLIIKGYRVLKCMTLPELALKAKVPKSSISKIENGKENATLGTLVRIFFVLDIRLRVDMIPEL